MPTCKTDLEQALYEALRQITRYADADWIRRNSQKRYGLMPDEATEMAYDNVLAVAKAAVKGVRARPRP